MFCFIHFALLTSHIRYTGLWDPHGDVHMGKCAESCAMHFEFTREEQVS